MPAVKRPCVGDKSEKIEYFQSPLNLKDTQT